MARGFLSGALWGLVVSGIGSGTASVLTGPVAAPDRGADPAPVASGEAEVVLEAPVEEATDLETTPPETVEPEATTPDAKEADATEQAVEPETDIGAEPKGAPVTEPEAQTPEAQTPTVEETEPSQEAEAAETPQTPEATAPQPNVASVEPIEEKAEAPADEPIIEQVDEADQVALPETNPSQDAGPDEEDEQASGPSVGEGASDLSQMAPGIATGRLPSVGGAEEASAPKKPLEAYAEPVDVPEGKPLMSIVLVDDGSTPLGLEALEAFPYPLTFAIDTEWPEAADAMARYRAAGFEVMALANLPQGALPSDAQVSLRVALDTVPEGVAVLEGDRGGLQGSRDVSDQVAQILAETGHGLVLYPKGLNTAVSLAQREGVPAQSLFRDFDGQGQNASVIRRFLDQAAFKAGQEGGVIMLGRLRAETISALLIWGLQDRASSVALVPVSKVLSQP